MVKGRSAARRWAVRLVVLCFALLGIGTLVLGILLAIPVTPPPPLASIGASAAKIGRTDLPSLSRFKARDGTDLAYRHYPGDAKRVAILIHGSSASSAAMHAVAKALSAAGITCYALDIRGHGASGTRGDIAYIGQLDDDFADFLAHLNERVPGVRPILVGHSSGGGFALRLAAEGFGERLDRLILLSPYLGHDAPTTRPDSGGWARASVPRIIGLSILNRAGLPIGGDLPVLAFAVEPEARAFLTATYSFKLYFDFRVGDYEAALRKAGLPIRLIAGADDELMVPDAYEKAMQAHGGPTRLDLVPGVDHIGVVVDEPALAAIVAAVGD